MMRRTLEGISVMSRILGSRLLVVWKVPSFDNLRGGELLPKHPLSGSALSLTGIVGVWK